MQITTISIDLAKNVFQVHGVDGHGKVVTARRLRRKQVIDFFGKIPSSLIGMEACATSHHWARELTGLGHTVRLIPPSYVKGYVKRSKNDAADAAAICEAVTRPSMRGRSWPREAPIACRHLRQPPEEAWQWELEARSVRDNRIARVMMA